MRTGLILMICVIMTLPSVAVCGSCGTYELYLINRNNISDDLLWTSNTDFQAAQGSKIKTEKLVFECDSSDCGNGTVIILKGGTLRGTFYDDAYAYECKTGTVNDSWEATPITNCADEWGDAAVPPSGWENVTDNIKHNFAFEKGSQFFLYLNISGLKVEGKICVHEAEKKTEEPTCKNRVILASKCSIEDADTCMNVTDCKAKMSTQYVLKCKSGYSPSEKAVLDSDYEKRINFLDIATFILHKDKLYKKCIKPDSATTSVTTPAPTTTGTCPKAVCWSRQI